MTRSHARTPRPIHTRPITAVIVLVAVIAAVLGAAPSQSSAAAAGAPSPFTDVASNAFYADAVDWLAEAGITTGTSATTFSPDDAVTRGQMAAFLERYAQVEGDPGGHGFGDVPSGVYYDAAVSFLVERDITTGTSATTYSPAAPVTRAQMATFLWRFSLEPVTSAAMPFTDVPAGTYYYDAVRWLANEGITTGVSPTRFDPDGVVTRGQMATFLWRLANEPAAGELGANRTDLDTTVVIDDSDISSESVLDAAGTSDLVWADEDVPDVGDIVVMGITDATPTGFIGAVTSVNGDEVTTQPATLEDAIPEVDFASNFAVEEESAGGGGALSALASSGGGAFENVDASCSTGGSAFEVVVDFDLDAGLALEASWDPVNGVQAFVGFDAGVAVDIEAIARGAVECSATLSIDGPRLQPISFWLGPVPVVLQPEMSLEIEIGGSFEAELTAGVFYSYDVHAGIRFRGGVWTTEYSTTTDSGVRLPILSAKATAGIELRGRLDIKAYGIGGPYITLGPFVELTVENRAPWWKVDAGLRASIGASIDVFFFKDDVQFAEIDLLRFRLADSDTHAPHDIPGGLGVLAALPLESVDSFFNHSCGTDAAGQVQCWGSNGDGQLGDGSLLDRNPAVKVAGITDAQAVTAGERHTCVLHDAGTVSCWGANDLGQLGTGTTTPSTTPMPVPGLSGVIALDAGRDQTCALLTDYTLSCWGRNDYGQIGDSTQTTRLVPTVVPGLEIVSDLSVGHDFVCVTQATGVVLCWGRNDSGQLGDGTTTLRSTPTVIPGAGPAAGVATGERHACAMRVDGSVNCWGANFDGQVGDGSTTERHTPVPVLDITSAAAIVAGRYHTCVELSVGGVRCWGSDQWEQLGDGGAPYSLRPRVVDLSQLSGTDIGSLTAGGVHTCAAMVTNRVTCWGANYLDQLGDGSGVSERSRPSSVVVPPT